MSRTGAKPVAVPDGIDATIDGQTVSAKGPKGELSVVLVDDVMAELNENSINLTARSDTKRGRAMWGMSRTLVANVVNGVKDGFVKSLEIQGVGYRAQVQGKSLNLALGLSHDVNYPIPEGIEINCPSQTEIVVSGIDRQQVGQVAAEIRNFRPPEPYKGKGVRYAGEYVYRKEGKKK